MEVCAELHQSSFVCSLLGSVSVWVCCQGVVVPLPHTLTPWLGALGRLWEAHQSPPVRYLQCCVHGLQSCSLEPKGSLILQSTLRVSWSHSPENKTKQKTRTHIHKTHKIFQSSVSILKTPSRRGGCKGPYDVTLTTQERRVEAAVLKNSGIGLLFFLPSPSSPSAHASVADTSASSAPHFTISVFLLDSFAPHSNPGGRLAGMRTPLHE